MRRRIKRLVKRGRSVRPPLSFSEAKIGRKLCLVMENMDRRGLMPEQAIEWEKQPLRREQQLTIPLRMRFESTHNSIVQNTQWPFFAVQMGIGPYINRFTTEEEFMEMVDYAVLGEGRGYIDADGSSIIKHVFTDQGQYGIRAGLFKDSVIAPLAFSIIKQAIHANLFTDHNETVISWLLDGEFDADGEPLKFNRNTLDEMKAVYKTAPIMDELERFSALGAETRALVRDLASGMAELESMPVTKLDELEGFCPNWDAYWDGVLYPVIWDQDDEVCGQTDNLIDWIFNESTIVSYLCIMEIAKGKIVARSGAEKFNFMKKLRKQTIECLWKLEQEYLMTTSRSGWMP